MIYDNIEICCPHPILNHGRLLLKISIEESFLVDSYFEMSAN